MSLIPIVILANSWKHGDWCLAGIELDTGTWIRPVSRLNDGRVRRRMMRLGGHFPELLDIIDIPLDETGPDFDFESENRTILPGKWNSRGKADVNVVLKYAEQPMYVLHNHKKYCTLQEMQEKPLEQRKTLQLIRFEDFQVRDKRLTATDKHDWKGVIWSGDREIEVGLTDPVFFDRLNKGHKPSQECLLTMSMTLPHAFEGWEGSPPCWKLIAGVIEL